MSIQRERYGRFGIASTDTLGPVGFWAWGRIGDTTGMGVMSEPAEPVWFAYGDTREEALAKLKAELDGVGYYTCIGKGGVYRVLDATGAGTRRNGGIVCYQDEFSGRLFYRDQQDFDERMELVMVGKCR